MKIKVGSKIENIELSTADGNIFKTSSLKNKRYLLTFYRFASCPLCNLRINEFVKRYDEFGENFTIVGIFHSSTKNLNHFTSHHKAPFILLADENYKYFKKYEVERSFFRFFISQVTLGPKIFFAMFKGFIPYRIKGHIEILPVDILVNEMGVVEKVKYGKDIGDHLSFDEIKNFSQKDS